MLRLPVWFKEFTFSAVAILVILQASFVMLQSQNSDRTDTALVSILTGTNANIDPYYLSQATAGFEAGGLLSCVKIRRHGNTQNFFESSGPHCTASPSPRWLLVGENKVSTVKGANGEDWDVEFQQENGTTFYVAVWALRAFFLALAAALFSRFESKRQLESARAQSAIELANLASQVSHDIRSPLAVLEKTLSEHGDISHQQVLLVRSAAGRIRKIANDLLVYERDGKKPEPIGDHRILDLLLPIISEKQVLINDRPELVLLLNCRGGAGDCRILVPPDDFSRVISNLLNNAIEATESGTISIGVECKESMALICIEDTGTGIPESILSELGKKKVTFGKNKTDSGFGLGIFHATKCLEAWKGRFEVQSKAGVGTRVLLYVPVFNSLHCKGLKSEFLQQSEEENVPVSEINAILVDDDEAIHTLWKIAAKRARKNILCFFSHTDLEKRIDTFPLNTEIFLDLEFKEGNFSGLDYAKKLYEKGFRNIYLATGTSIDSIGPIPWLKGVQGKEPPWI